MAKELSCIDCAVTNCNTMDKVYPDFCLTTHMNEEAMEETMSCYREEVNQKIAVASAEVEHEGYCRLTRVEEIIEFARKMEVKKIGIATCVGLIRESRTLAKILRAHGFEVYGVGCKVGAVPKTEIGIPKECTEVGTNMCNPILQAKLLNAAKTDMTVFSINIRRQSQRQQLQRTVYLDTIPWRHYIHRNLIIKNCLQIRQR